MPRCKPGRMIRWAALFLLVPVCASAQTGKKQSPVPELNRKIVKFCIDNLGKKVDDGECAQLVTLAYKAAGAKPRSKLPAPAPPMKEDDYVWGRLLNPDKEAVLPGDVIQFRDVHIKVVYANGSWRTWSYPHHTAVVFERAGKGRYVILHQNVGDNTKTEEQKRLVQKDGLDLSRKLSGTVWFYRPLPAE